MEFKESWLVYIVGQKGSLRVILLDLWLDEWLIFQKMVGYVVGYTEIVGHKLAFWEQTGFIRLDIDATIN